MGESLRLRDITLICQGGRLVNVSANKRICGVDGGQVSVGIDAQNKPCFRSEMGGKSVTGRSVLVLVLVSWKVSAAERNRSRTHQDVNGEKAIVVEDV